MERLYSRCFASECARPTRGRCAHETLAAVVTRADAEASRIGWADSGVHRNLWFPVQPDPISGMPCRHQAVRVRKAEPMDRYGDVSVDTSKARGLPHCRPTLAELTQESGGGVAGFGQDQRG
jgi:hypothetical protein